VGAPKDYDDSRFGRNLAVDHAAADASMAAGDGEHGDLLCDEHLQTLESDMNARITVRVPPQVEVTKGVSVLDLTQHQLVREIVLADEESRRNGRQRRISRLSCCALVRRLLATMEGQVRWLGGVLRESRYGDRVRVVESGPNASLLKASSLSGGVTAVEVADNVGVLDVNRIQLLDEIECAHDESQQTGQPGIVAVNAAASQKQMGAS
jgi:hypothetical protein